MPELTGQCLTNGWSTCQSSIRPSEHVPHTDTEHVPHTDTEHVPHTDTEHVPHTDTEHVPRTSDSPEFQWHVIESLARESSPLTPCPSTPSTPKRATIQRLFAQNCYLQRRVRDLTQHLLRNKTTFL
jgi:hypothetical protein